MAVQKPGGYTKLAIAIVLAAVMVSATIIGSSVLQKTTTTTLTSVSTITRSGAATQTSSITTVSGASTSCEIASEGQLLLKVENSSTGGPIGAIPVQIENLYPECPPNPHTVQDIGTVDTNESGILILGGLGEDYLTIDYGLRSYSVNASLGPEYTTCVTLGIPSGELSISYTQPFETNCKPAAGSAIATSTVTTVSTATVTSTEVQTQTVESPNGLELQVSANATTIQQGGALRVSIAIFNPINANVSVPLGYNGSSNISIWSDYDFVCGSNPSYWMVGYALFQGHYTSANISSSSGPLALTPPLALSCIEVPFPPTITFLPNSSAVSHASIPPNNLANTMMNVSTEYCSVETSSGGTNSSCPLGTSLFGYWNTSLPATFPNQNDTLDSRYLIRFPPGDYTLVVEDEWGQTVYDYFQVTATTS